MSVTNTASLIPLPAQDFVREANYINGHWQQAADGRTLEVIDPATGAAIGTIPLSGTSETALAIEAASDAFPAWSAQTANERATLLHALAAEIRLHRDALASLLTLEQGKPLAEALAEIDGGAAYVQWFAEEARRIYGEVIPSPWANRRILTLREPVGVVGAITPWNFPFSMIARKLGPALAAGCTMVIKPAELTPYCGLAWGVLAERAGIPAGVVNIVTGDAPAIGEAMLTHPKLRKITFTGSTPVGKYLAGRAAAAMKRFSMELGGNAPFLVFEDADLNAAAEGAMVAKFRNAGQTCVCVNRFFVQQSVYHAFAERLAARIHTLRTGSGFTPGVTVGPLINQAAIDKTATHIADALAKGGQLVIGTPLERNGSKGTFHPPTLILNGTADMLAMKEETFGPLAILTPFETEAEAIDAANATEYGLAAYAYTRDLGRAFRVSSALQYGMVGLNTGLITTEVAPFGGVKDSGVGREGSRHGIEDYVSIKYVSLGGL